MASDDIPDVVGVDGMLMLVVLPEVAKLEIRTIRVGEVALTSFLMLVGHTPYCYVKTAESMYVMRVRKEREESVREESKKGKRKKKCYY